MVAIYVSSDSREDSWAAAIDPSGSVLDHLQIPHNRDARAKKLKVNVKQSGNQQCLWSDSTFAFLLLRRGGVKVTERAPH